MTLDTEPMYCAEQINIPDNLGEILKAYAKEVIRQQPGNIYEFSARYFAQVRNWPSPLGGNVPAARALRHARRVRCPRARAHLLRGLRCARFARALTPARARAEQLDQQEEDFIDQGDTEISREIVFRLVLECQAIGRDDLEVGKLRELCEQSGVPLGATSGILELILPPDDTSGHLQWKHFVVALCAQVGGVEDVTGFVRLLLDPGMFGNDDGQLSKTEFITLFDWWSSIDTSISAELKSALFAALDPKDAEVPLSALARAAKARRASSAWKGKKGIGVAKSVPRLRLRLYVGAGGRPRPRQRVPLSAVPAAVVRRMRVLAVGACGVGRLT